MEKKEKEKKKKSKKKKKKKKNLEFSRIFANIREIRENARIFGKLFVGGTVNGGGGMGLIDLNMKVFREREEKIATSPQQGSPWQPVTISAVYTGIKKPESFSHSGFSLKVARQLPLNTPKKPE